MASCSRSTRPGRTLMCWWTTAAPRTRWSASIPCAGTPVTASGTGSRCCASSSRGAGRRRCTSSGSATGCGSRLRATTSGWRPCDVTGCSPAESGSPRCWPWPSSSTSPTGTTHCTTARGPPRRRPSPSGYLATRGSPCTWTTGPMPRSWTCAATWGPRPRTPPSTSAARARSWTMSSTPPARLAGRRALCTRNASPRPPRSPALVPVTASSSGLPPAGRSTTSCPMTTSWTFCSATAWTRPPRASRASAASARSGCWPAMRIIATTCSPTTSGPGACSPSAARVPWGRASSSTCYLGALPPVVIQAAVSLVWVRDDGRWQLAHL